MTPTESGEQTIRALRDSHDHLATQLFGSVPSRRMATFAASLDETIAVFARLMEEET